MRLNNYIGTITVAGTSWSLYKEKQFIANCNTYPLKVMAESTQEIYSSCLDELRNYYDYRIKGLNWRPQALPSQDK